MVKSNCNNIAKRLFIAFFCLLALVVEAKQVTITPLSGSAWFLGVEEFGYLRIVGDSLIIYRNTGEEVSCEALVNIQRIAVEENTPTVTPTVKTETNSIKVYDGNGQITIRKQGRKYGIDGLRRTKD